MDEVPGSRFKNIFKKLFGSNGHPLEEHILEAEEEGELEKDEVSMLLNILDLDEKEVSEIMVPRTDMVCAENHSSVEDVARIIFSLGAHSRIPLFEETKDRIIGQVHAKDLLEPLLRGMGAAPASSYMRPPYFVPEDMSLDMVLSRFKKNKIHMAIVQDEYGGTAGLVTMEDVLEEIVGEIADEYDEERPDEFVVNKDGSLTVSGRVTLEDLCEKCALELESEDVDSIGGYLAAMAGRIPHAGEFFMIDNMKFTVLEADERQIWSIRLEQAPESQTPDE